MKKTKCLSLLILLFLIISLPQANAVLCLKLTQSVGDSCVEIKLKNGKIYNGKLLENNAIRVRFTTCPPDDGSILNVNKFDVLQITKPDMTVIYDQAEANREPVIKAEKKKNRSEIRTSPFAILGFVFSLLSLLVTTTRYLSIPLFAASLACAIKGLVQIKKSEGKLRGKDVAIIALILLGIAIFFALKFAGLIF